MAIQSLTVHRIQRFQDDQPSELRLGKDLVDAGADYQSLFSQLKKLFQFKVGKLFGHFDANMVEAPFQSWLRDHQENRTSFEKLSQLYIEKLKDLLDATSEIFEYYAFVLLEERADSDRLYIFLLESSSGLAIDDALQLDVVEPLNTSKLDLALRVELDDWKDAASAAANLEASDQNADYLCLVKARGTGKIGEAFEKSIGFNNSIDTVKETENLMEALARYTQSSEPNEAANLRKKAYDFCVEQQQSGEAVPLTELSGALDENAPEKFEAFARENTQLDAARPLHPDTRKLKHMVRISGKGNGLSLSFSSDLIQQTILFNEEQDTLTITSIPKSLKQQILEHLKENSDQD